MTITATELKTNLGKYLEMVNDEEIIITKNGKSIARLSKPESDRIDLLNSLVGVAKKAKNMSEDDDRLERILNR
ncbi:MAG: type II toxin-antitoxin system prevent-host-death family antitoxin [Erysipelotrichaceae bacterium]|nr:type II toxin-antitoxin system prevent-host-death family antitoxin [Erysipelotrichaceae bacterium]